MASKVVRIGIFMLEESYDFFNIPTYGFLGHKQRCLDYRICRSMEHDQVCWVGKDLEGSGRPTFFTCSPENTVRLSYAQGCFSAS